MTDSRLEFEESLIDLVRGHPCLYSKYDEDYKNKNVKENAWASIGGILGMTSTETRSAWTPLRQQYIAFLRKLEILENSPGTGNPSTRPHFRHEKSMAFCRETRGNETSPWSNSLNVSKIDEFENSNSKFSTGTGKRKIDNNVEEKVLTFFEQGSNCSPDEWDQFCSSMASKLRRMHRKDSGIAAEAEFKIHEVIYNMECKLAAKYS